MDIKEAIERLVYYRTYQPVNKFTYNYRVESVGDNEYVVYIVNSFADIVYSFEDVREEEYEDDEPGYSAIVKFVSCNITPYMADTDTEYYADKLDDYIEKCELVSHILKGIDVYLDTDKRTYF